jgi:mannose-1-phosphate guanylyltransferase
MILAAGLGQRMRPLSECLAKPVMPVLNRPLLHFTLEQLQRAGVREVVVNLHHLPQTVRRALGDGRGFGLEIRYSCESEILGTGGGLRRARRRLGSEPVLIVNGDVLFDFDLRQLVERHRRSGAEATLALRPNPDLNHYRPVITNRRGRILSIKGRPRAAGGTASLFTGVHVLNPALLARLPPGYSDVVDALYIPLLAEGALLEGVRVRGAWHDLGQPELYLRTQLRMLRRAGRALVAPSARVHASARIATSAIGAGCRVGERAQIQDSVLWTGVEVGADARVERSVVADGVHVPARARWRRCVAVLRQGRLVRVALEPA